MQLRSVTFRGLGPFREQTTLDFEALGDAVLVAVCGPNGAGKSTLLELALPGSMFRSCPTRGALKDLATSRDAMLEATIVNGKPYRVRHLVDAISGKSEAVAFDEAGVPLFDSSKVKAFDAWAATALPAPEVLYSSVFGAQAAGGFLAAKPSERKSLLLKVLGIQRWETYAEHCRERARDARLALELVKGRLVDEEGRCSVSLQMAEEAVERARETLQQAERELGDARQLVLLREDEAKRVEAAQQAARDAARVRADLAARLDVAKQRVADLDSRIANNRRVLKEADDIREAAADLEGGEAQCAGLRQEIADLDAQRKAAEQDSARHQETHLAAKGRATRESQRVERLRLVLAGETAVAEMLDSLPALEAGFAVARSECEAAEARLAELREQRVAGAEERASALRDGLENIASLDGYEEEGREHAIAVTTLEADDTTLRLARELPAQLQQAEQAQRSALVNLQAVELDLQKARNAVAAAPDFEAVRRELAEAEAQLERETHDAARDKKAAELVEERARQLGAERDAKYAQERDVDAKNEAFRSLAMRIKPLEQAEGRIAELTPLLEQAQAEAVGLAAQLDGAPEPIEPPRTPDVAAVKAEEQRAASTVEQCRLALSRAEDGLTMARASWTRREALQAERARTEAELADWNRLADDCGKKGVQAATIDAALPELVTIANDLLHRAAGPRFTIDLRTQALNSTGKKTLETLDVVVIDTESGREALAETYSGGERVFLAEALSLAITTLSCREHGVESPTLIRDESGAALDPERARQWIAMLRRAVTLIGAQRCLLVSHSPEVQELCDARIVVADGGVRVE